MKIHKSGQIFSISCGNILHIVDYDTHKHRKTEITPPPLASDVKKETKLENHQIVSLACSKDGQQIAVATESKIISILNRNLECVHNFITNRVPTKIMFTNDNKLILADKTGDVYTYDLKTNAHSLLLGHLSMILDFDLSPCGRYIITCDRDEKIRVSKFPNAYNIVSYCLGHTEFVLNVKVVGNFLFSASGDGSVRIWDFKSGKLLKIIETSNYLNDKDVVEEFKSSMLDEKIRVSALPITEMQTYSPSENNVFIALTLFNVNHIQIYNVELPSLAVSHVRNVSVTNSSFSYFLSDYLYILSDSQLLLYKFSNNDYVQIELTNELRSFLESYSFKIDDNKFDIFVMYKRKFDNVQEYLNRKKMRLESNNKNV